MRVLTIGHSTHPIEEFIELLTDVGVTDLVDVRTLPGSNRNPQFNEENLRPSLDTAGIPYFREARLGGLRKAVKGIDPAVNGFWENKSFHRYADHAQGEEFRAGLEALIELARSGRLPVIMCAEAVWWRCHRRIIADFLLVRDITVGHIMPDGRVTEASLTRGAVIDGQSVTYPPSPDGGEST